MKVVDVSFFYDENVAIEEQLLQQHYTTVGWAEALQRKGVEVIVVKRFHKDSLFQKNNVKYHFIKDRFGGILKPWQVPGKVFKQIAASDADVVQLHNFSLSIQNRLLGRFVGKKVAVVIQHHGGPLPTGIRKSFHDVLNKGADGFFFTTTEQGKQWFTNKRVQSKIMPVMEGSTFFDYASRDTKRTFEYADRTIARKKTKIEGNPVFLWVGRLDKNKDPLAVISGFEILLKNYDGAALYMIYNDAKLLNEVQARIGDSETLKNKIHLLGEIPHPEIENYYNSADYFVLGSHYEGSGYALSEALRCGCVPIITNIPSFYMMTNNGQLGALWQPGNVTSFTEAVAVAIAKPLPVEGKACIDFFTNTLSFDAIAETAIGHYRKLIEVKSK